MREKESSYHFRRPVLKLVSTLAAWVLVAVAGWAFPVSAEFTDAGCGRSISEPVVDLAVLGMEITQGIQCFDPLEGATSCADNSIPQLSGRPTVVRVYVDVGLGFIGTVYSNVTALLFVRRAGDPEPGTLIAPANGPITLRIPQTDEIGEMRAFTNGTLNFRIPSEWLSGRIVLRAYVNPYVACGPLEDNFTNNWSDQLIVDFEEEECPLTIYYHPANVPELGLAHPRVDDAWAHFYNLWPAGAPPIYRRRGSIDLSYNPGDRPTQLVRDLNRMYAGYVLALLFGGPAPPRILFGWAPDTPRPRNTGYADVPWDPVGGGFSVSAWNLDRESLFEKGLTHEVAHNFNQHHAGVPPWPYDTTNAQEVGWHMARMEAVDAERRDVMANGVDTNEVWVSPYTYMGIREGVPFGNFCAEDDEAPGEPFVTEHILVEGRLFLDGTGHFTSIHGVESARRVEPPPQGGPDDACIEFRDANGGPLSSHCFEVSFLNEETGSLSEQTLFLRDVAFPKNAASIRLTDGNQAVLDERVASPNPPTVEVISPLAGEAFTGEATIVWHAEDSDGDPLEFSLFYSPDGAAWELAAREVGQGSGPQEPTPRRTRETDFLNPLLHSHVFDTRFYPGSPAAQIRIVATDGFHTSFADSAPFSVVGKPLQVQVDPAIQGAIYPNARSVLLLGRAFGPETGEIPGDDLLWFSSREGFLGRGNHVVPAHLRAGQHEIRLLALSGKQPIAIASAWITVLEDERMSEILRLLDACPSELERCLIPPPPPPPRR